MVDILSYPLIFGPIFYRSLFLFICLVDILRNLLKFQDRLQDTEAVVRRCSVKKA